MSKQVFSECPRAEGVLENKSSLFWISANIGSLLWHCSSTSDAVPTTYLLSNLHTFLLTWTGMLCVPDTMSRAGESSGHFQFWRRCVWNLLAFINVPIGNRMETKGAMCDLLTFDPMFTENENFFRTLLIYQATPIKLTAVIPRTTNIQVVVLVSSKMLPRLATYSSPPA